MACTAPSSADLSVHIMQTATCYRLIAVVLFTLKWTQHATTQHHCVDIRFLNHQNDVIHSIVNHYINITFAVDWVNCSLSTDGGLIKVVANISGHDVDECKLPVTRNMCNVSDNTPCVCLSPAGPIIFRKRMAKAGNMTYLWLHQGKVMKERVLIVSSDNPDPDGEAFVPAVNSTHDPLYRQILMGGVIACSVIVVVSIIGGVIVCYRLGMIRRRPQAGGRRQNSAKGFLTDGWESDRPQSEGLYDDLYCSTKL